MLDPQENDVTHYFRSLIKSSATLHDMVIIY